MLDDKDKQTVATSRSFCWLFPSQKAGSLFEGIISLNRSPLRTTSLHVSNRCSLLSDTPAEKHSLVVGSSIVRNVKMVKPRPIVRCIPGARAGDVEARLKRLAKDKRSDSKIVLHVGGNESRLRRSSVTKMDVESVCAYAKAMLDS